MPKIVFQGVLYKQDGDRLIKSADPVRYIMRWNRMEIGVSHCPRFGDSRHGKKVCAGYGHIRGSYGDALDGMSLDVYIGPDLASQKVFAVKQVIPDTGEVDEEKYVIGCWSESEAKDLYLKAMPEKFFGGIRPVPLKSLAKYQK